LFNLTKQAQTAHLFSEQYENPSNFPMKIYNFISYDLAKMILVFNVMSTSRTSLLKNRVGKSKIPKCFWNSIH
jgi:hypothetical protein